MIGDAGPNRTQENIYAHEVRFGVVMYGGVSLAIYINGVANELYEMACATPKACGDRTAAATREVYRKASWLMHDPELRERYLEHLRNPQQPDPFSDGAALASAQRSRFVVDTIAGTSAGGINGLFLAKALANGQEFAPLKKLWIQEGDIDSLLNDEASYKGLEFAKTDSPPRSLLNSDRMYVKLVDAFQKMATAIKPMGESESPLVDEIDLFITTTDIRGAVVPLRLFDKVVYEKRYKQVYHFQYAAADGRASRNDLADENTPFLAFAARCTSSFPFAFEPMCVLDAQRLCDARPTRKAIDFGTWKPFFTGLSSDDMAKERWRNRAFGDGGYLDNKPFSYVVDALSWRLGGLPMERKLIYVEPAPAHPERERQNYDNKPDAIENAFRAVFAIPQDETIREDLESVLARNRRIERVERIVRQVEADIEMRDVDPFARIVLVQGNVPDWRGLDLTAMIDYYGVAFLPYRRLRLATVTDDIAERLAVWWGIDRRSDRLYALKALVRAWREENYYENKTPGQDTSGKAGTVNAFLDDYDVKYRLRRVGFLLRKVHQLLGLAMKLRLHEATRGPMSDIEIRLQKRWERRNPSLSSMNSEALVGALSCLASGFGEAMGELRAATWLPAPPDKVRSRATSLDMLDRVLRLLLGEELDTEQKELDTRTGKVSLRTDLPPPSPLRTLQENVFARASVLFERAKQGPKTEIQELLEADVGELREAYAKVIRSSPERKVPLARDLLGEPRLDPSSLADGAKPTVVIRIKDVALPRDVTPLNTPEGRALRKFLAEYYVRFDEYDQMSFPLYYDTGTGEPSTVEVLRVSPEDACSLIDELNDHGDKHHSRQKLAGTALFHFGAFLDARWRRNDIMWGRLDGCERLLTALFPESADQELRQALLQEAQRTIVREEMQPEGYGELINRFEKALAEQKEPTLEKAFEGLWAHLAPGDEQRRTQMAQILKAVLGDAGMVEYVRRYYEINRELDTKMTLSTGARVLTITGRILEESEKRRGSPSPRMVWLTRAGRALQTLLAISTPGSLYQAIFRHWLGLLYVFELLIVAGSLLFSVPTARTFGLTAFGVTASLHVASLIAEDLIGRKRGWLMLTAAMLAFALLVLAALGAIALYNGGLQGTLCAGGLWCRRSDAWRRLGRHIELERCGKMRPFLMVRNVQQSVQHFVQQYGLLAL